MIKSTFCVLLVISTIKAAPNSYLDSIPGLGEWISYSSDSEKESVKAKNEEVPNEEQRKVVDASKSDEDMKVVNPDHPLPVDDLLDELNDEVKENDDEHNKEMVGVLEQLRSAVYDNSIRRVNVLRKGIWHLVDLGLAGSAQRKRSAEKADGILEAILNVFRAVRDWWYGLWGWDVDDEKHEDKDDKDKEKDKSAGGEDKDKHLSKGEKDATKLSNPDFDGDDDDKTSKSPLKEGDSNDSTKKDGKDVDLKPLVKPDGQDDTHTSSNGKVIYDSTHRNQALDDALTDLSKLLGQRLKTREEVDKSVKDAREKKDTENKYYKHAENSKQHRGELKDIDQQDWAEADALKKLEKMDKEFDTADKASMVKEITSLSWQPFYYVETYDKILDMIDRLRASGGDEKLLDLAETFANEQKVFSLKDSIQQTPKHKYLTDSRKIHEEKSAKEKQKHPNTRDWKEEDAKNRLKEINEEFDKMADKVNGDKTVMVKDITSMSMQPFFHTDTYDDMYDTIQKLKNEGKVPEGDFKVADNSLKRQARFALMQSILEAPDEEEFKKYRDHIDAAKKKREQLGYNEEIKEQEALKKIDDMTTNFDSKDKPSMVKDVTNLSMQPLYHVETYEKMTPLIEKLKTAEGVTEADLKPAMNSLAAEIAFSSSSGIRKITEGSLADELKNLKNKYLLPTLQVDKKREFLPVDQKKELLTQLGKILSGVEKISPAEAEDANALLKALSKHSSGIDQNAVNSLIGAVDNAEKKYAASGNVNSGNQSNSKVVSHVDLAHLSVKDIDPNEFKPVTSVNGGFVPKQ